MDAGQLTAHVKKVGARLGFDHVGVAGPDALPHGDYVHSWLESGQHGDMAYLEQHVDKRLAPRALMPGCRSVIVVALNYRQPAPPSPDGPSARVAMYAWGEDYHVVMKDKLWALVDTLRDAVPEPFEAKVCVDTAPILEREVAMRAGVGWIGKNTLTLNQHLGSYFFLGEVLTTLDLVPDRPATDHCGTCTRCLDACPTAAFPAPYQMDATRCISYHTIELRAAIPQEFHAAIGPWLFGCDVCQEVCPFNDDTPVTAEPRFGARSHAPALAIDDVLAWDLEAYRRALSKTAVKRAKLPMLQRNAAIVKRNSSD